MVLIEEKKTGLKRILTNKHVGFSKKSMVDIGSLTAKNLRDRTFVVLSLLATKQNNKFKIKDWRL
jgi:hypothetical protein